MIKGQKFYNVGFFDASSFVGELDWGTGVLKFKGSADKSARIFFEEELKKLVDEYIKEKSK